MPDRRNRTAWGRARALALAGLAAGGFALAGAPGARAQDHQLTEPGGRAAQPSSIASVNAVDSVLYRSLVTNNNLVAVTLTNYGFIGNNFISRAPSFEYPAGLGYEHMVRAGLWVGGHSTLGGGEFDGVVTGTTDGATSGASQAATEFTPAGNEFLRRSILLTDPFYNTSAISEQDIISSYSDFPSKRAAQNLEDHTPMGLLVTQENYSWSFSDFANILFFHFKIKNTGPTLTRVYVGIYSEFASGNKNAYTNWAPSSADPSGTGSWFNKKWIQYDDSLRLYREHYCRSLPIPDGCQLDRAPYWVGLRLLGARGLAEDTTTKQVTLQGWSWNPSSGFRGHDYQRYDILTRGVMPLVGDSLQPQTGDPCGVFAIGPFPRIYTDSTVTVDFALIGGKEIADLQQHSRVAQRAYDLNYIVPIPPPSPRLKIVSRDESLDLYWDDTSELATDPTSADPHDFEGYKVYIGESRDQLRLIGQFDSNTAPGDTTGFNTGFAAVRLPSPVTLDGRTYRYKYTIPSLRNGFKYFAAVTAFDRGNNLIEPLESGQTQNIALAVPGPTASERAGTGPTVYPNPYRVEARWDQGDKVRDHYLWFTKLPQRCTLRIFTLSGDLVFEREFDGSTYRGDSARGLYNPSSGQSAPTLSGTTFAWDLITREGQAAATGLYLFSVENKDGGDRTVGKFLIVKSDRE